MLPDALIENGTRTIEMRLLAISAHFGLTMAKHFALQQGAPAPISLHFSKSKRRRKKKEEGKKKKKETVKEGTQ